jgi:hypothetical protein
MADTRYNFTHQKAGMAGVDRARVASVVEEMSRGSRFHTNALAHEERSDKVVRTCLRSSQTTHAPRNVCPLCPYADTLHRCSGRSRC